MLESSDRDSLHFECTASIQIFILVFLINYADHSSEHGSDFLWNGLVRVAIITSATCSQPGHC